MNSARTLKALFKESRANQYIVFVCSIAYLTLYLIAIRDIQLTNATSGLQSAPLQRAVEMSSFLGFRPVLELVISPVVVFISPINIIIGLVLSVLVGLNVLLMYTIYTRPKQCKISDTVGVLASVPTLVSGTACCGPIIPVILGLQVTGAFVAFTTIALPLSIVSLLVTTVLLLRRITV